MELKFIVDSMFGKLARRLRMLGYDTIYAKDMEDRKILEIAEDEGRILITRDKKLLEYATEAYIIDMPDVDIEDQIQILVEELNLNTENIEPTRCPMCNGLLEEIDKEKVKDKVGEKAYEANDKFWECKECEQIYWKGTHWDHVMDSLDQS